MVNASVSFSLAGRVRVHTRLALSGHPCSRPVVGVAAVALTVGSTTGGCKGLVDRGLEAADMLHRHILRLSGGRCFNIFVQSGKDLRV